MGAKKQQTFAKLQRERRVKEKRQLKLEKKAARKLGITDEFADDFSPVDGEALSADADEVAADQPVDEVTPAPPE
jgi:hypothetical protein